jgi:hypothetical protein
VNPIRTAAAVARLKLADRALDKLDAETDQTPRWQAANRRVADADANPHLPERFRDPRDVEDDRTT